MRKPSPLNYYEFECSNNLKESDIISLSNVRNIFICLWSFIVISQCLLWPSIESLVGAVIVFFGGNLGIFYCLRRNILLEFPVSALVFLGFLSYYFLLPPLVTIVEWKALTNNLLEPVLVFFNAFLCLLSLILAHFLYRNCLALNIPKILIRDFLYKPLGFFNTPSNLQLMLIGFLGMAAMGYRVFVLGSSTYGELGKFIQGFIPLVYVPYCIFIKELIGSEDKVGVKWFWIIIIYTVVLVLFSLGGNSRSAFLIGVMSITLAYIYANVVGLIKKKIISVKKIIICVLVLFSFSGPLTDIAISMVIVRGQRVDISAMDLLSETLNIYQDKEAIRIAKILMAEENSSGWDEVYIDNLFFSRLSNLKFTDNSIVLSKNLDLSQVENIRSIEWLRIISLLPSPVISMFGMPVDKDFVTSGSGGDFLYATATGDKEVIGGFRTGSIIGSGYALFGWFYPIVFGFICIVSFSVMDAQVKIIRETSTDGDITIIPVFNCLTIATLFSWFFYLTSAATGVESMSELAGYILRGWLQNFVIYSIAYWLTYSSLRILRKC